jgi:hypothetical protein
VRPALSRAWRIRSGLNPVTPPDPISRGQREQS